MGRKVMHLSTKDILTIVKPVKQRVYVMEQQNKNLRRRVIELERTIEARSNLKVGGNKK